MHNVPHAARTTKINPKRSRIFHSFETGNDSETKPHNDTVQQRGRLERLHVTESRDAGPVCCNGLILIMVSLGMGRGLS
jgi:hypothetical protein